MSNFKEYPQPVERDRWNLFGLKSSHTLEDRFPPASSRQPGLILWVGALAVLMIAAFFLFSYPLETVIVLLFMGSIFAMRQG